MIYHNELKL